MIINSNTAAYSSLSSALVRHGKRVSATGAKEASSAANQDSLEASDNNLTVDSPIQDVDAANAIAEQMRQSILGQPAAAMLAQAQLVPQQALRLLQQ